MRTIVFEGFADTGAGWDFDMPVYMIRPVKLESAGGSVEAAAEALVEDYVIDLSLGEQWEDEEGPWGNAMRQFRKARDGKSERFVYWRQEVRVPDEGADEDDWDELTEYGDLHTGPMPTAAA